MGIITFRELKEMVPEFKGKRMTAKQLEKEEILFAERVLEADITVFKNGCLLYRVMGGDGKPHGTIYTVHRCSKIVFEMGFSKEEYKEGWKCGECQITYKIIDGQLTKLHIVPESAYLDEPWWLPVVTICEERMAKNEARRARARVSLRAEEGDEDLDPALIVPDFLDALIAEEDRFEKHKVLMEAMKTLTTIQRKTVLIYYSNPGMTERNVAEIVGCESSTVHRNLEAAIKKLRKFFLKTMQQNR